MARHQAFGASLTAWDQPLEGLPEAESTQPLHGLEWRSVDTPDIQGSWTFSPSWSRGRTWWRMPGGVRLAGGWSRRPGYRQR